MSTLRKRLVVPVLVIAGVVGMVIAPQTALADTSYDSIWNTVGWTPIPDPTTLDAATLSACATQTPWTVVIELTNQGNGLGELAKLVKPPGKCAEKFYGTKITITDDGGPTQTLYQTSGTISAYQWVGYGDLPPLVAPDSVANTNLAQSVARIAKIKFVFATTTGQNWWTCLNSTWAAASATHPVEVETDTSTSPNCP